jgi:hypothetical protein
MSLLVCPLCGKSTSLRRYDPTDFADDILVQNVRGLGRGRGFAVVGRRSILDDAEITRLIGERVLTIARLLLDHDRLSTDDVVSRLGPHVADAGERTALHSAYTSLHERVARLVTQIEESLGDDWSYETDLDHGDIAEVLKERVEALLDEYAALDAEREVP